MRSSLVLTLASGLLAFVLVRVGLAQRPSQDQRGIAKQQPGAKAANQAKARVSPGDWPLYSRDLTSARYSPLTQINTANVAQLRQAWTFQMSPPLTDTTTVAAEVFAGRFGREREEVTPIVVNGIMYLPAGNHIFALEADSGKEIWAYAAPGLVTNRAVGYWPGEKQTSPRLIFTTGGNMMALNANTGTVDTGFGREGAVDIGANWGGAPYIVNNLIIVGVNNGESSPGPPGDTRRLRRAYRS